MSTKKAVMLAVLLAMSIVLSIVESFLPSFGIIGAKLGLANIITIVVLYTFNDKDAFMIVILRILLVPLLRGFNFNTFMLSLSGGMLAFFLMWSFKRMKIFNVVSVSVMGSLGHALGQVLMAMVLLDLAEIGLYFPVLFAIAIPTGVFVGLTGSLLKTRLQEANLIEYENETY